MSDNDNSNFLDPAVAFIEVDRSPFDKSALTIVVKGATVNVNTAFSTTCLLFVGTKWLATSEASTRLAYSLHVGGPSGPLSGQHPRHKCSNKRDMLDGSLSLSLADGIKVMTRSKHSKDGESRVNCFLRVFRRLYS